MNSSTTSSDASLELCRWAQARGLAVSKAQAELASGLGSGGKRFSTWRAARWCSSVLAVSVWASLASAQGKVVTIAEVTIVGRVQKPIAAVDVSRIQPQMTLAELRQPFLDRIEKAVYRAPF